MTKYFTDFIMTTIGGQLSLADKSSHKFWKMVMGYGEFVDPNDPQSKMVLDKSVAEEMARNFESGPINRLPVPLGHPMTSGELAADTKGWVEKLEARDDGLYALMEIKDEETAEKIKDGLIEDTSVAFDKVYTDKKTGSVFHNVLRHIGLVNDPYIKGMEQFQPVLAEMTGASMLFSDGAQDDDNNSNKEGENTMKNVINNREFDVEVKYMDGEEEVVAVVKAGEELEVPEVVAEEVQKQIDEAVEPTTEEDDKGGGDDELSDDEKKEKELAEREAKVAAAEAKLRADAAEAKFSELVKEGKLVPAQKDAFIALSTKVEATVQLSDDESKTVAELLSDLVENAAVHRLDDEEGDGGDGKKDDEPEVSDEELKVADKMGVSKEELSNVKKEEK